MIDLGEIPRPRVRLLPLPKPGGTRWLTTLDPTTAAAYAAAVATVAPTIESSLLRAVAANRVAFARGTRLRLQPWRAARTWFLAEARRLAASSGAILVTDVRECYASIRPENVSSRLLSIGCGEGDVARIVELLAGFVISGVPGLPIGPDASAVLANAVLAAGDEALADAGIAHLRWVDDFVAFTPDAAGALAALERLREVLAELGLALAENKTAVVGGPHGIERVVSGAISGSTARYHRRADAHPLPGFEGPHAVPSADGGVDPHRRQARPARGER